MSGASTTPAAPAPPASAARTSAAAVRLVATREVTMRLRSRAYLLTTVITVALVVAGVLVAAVVGGHPPTSTVAVAAGDRPTLGAQLRADGGRELRVRAVADATAGSALVRRGKVDAFVAPSTAGLAVVVRQDLGTSLRSTLSSVAAGRALDAQVRQLGGNPASVAAALSSARLDVRSLAPRAAPDPTRLALGGVAAFLIFLSLQTAGQSVAMGVVEEKASRVVEVLLSTVRPWQLMTGKVLGLGALGLVQVVLVAGAGLAAGLASGVVDLPASTALTLVGWVALWFVLGYTAFAVVFAALGALVSRPEEIGGVTAPVLFVVLGGYVMGVGILPTDPGNRYVAALSLVPAFSPTLMPVRLAIGGVPAWQTALALVLLVAVIPVLVWAAARVYRNAVVRSGVRVKLLDALRGS